MEESLNTIVETRKELMVSPTGGDNKPTLRTAHFLNSTATSIDRPLLELPSDSSFSTNTSSQPKKCPLNVTFNGWRYPQKNWKTWVDTMHSKHQYIWKQAGIYDAIMCSTYRINKHNDLVLGLADKWSAKTNTFIFPWGEATITLEDMIISGSYSALGSPVFSPLETRESIEIEDKLSEERGKLTRTKARKAGHYQWMMHFMESESEFEHEAFLSLWLSRYVFPGISRTISKYVFPIAIHLARGAKLALAPAVLASIYRDLSLLKEKIVASSLLDCDMDKDDVLGVTLHAPFQLVQVWAWERFERLHPKPNKIDFDEPWLARWNEVKILKHVNVRLAVDSANESFLWRPYAMAMDNFCHSIYGETEKWVSIDFDMGEELELESFVRCLRTSELVGIDCIEQYCPNRVAMQFGMDQDIPGHVIRCNETPEIAWSTYDKPIKDAKLYVPSRMFKPNVTSRYLKWWKQSVSGCKDASKSPKSSNSLPSSSKRRSSDNDASVPSGFASKISKLVSEESDKKEVDEDIITVREFLRSCDKHNSVGKGMDSDGKTSLRAQSHSSSPAESGVNIKTEPVMESTEKIVQGEAVIVSGGAGKVMEDGNEDKVQSQVESENGGESGSNCTLALPGLELEAKISKLERAVAELKAARFGYRFGENQS